MNEHQVVVSSMNLYDYSGQNSFEIAVAITGEAAKERIRSYVRHSIVSIASPIGARSVFAPSASTKSGKRIRPSTPVGTYLRCGQKVKFDLDRPLCGECYEEWAIWGNEEYMEEYCHSCGREADVISYARPLCRPCYVGR